MTSASLATIWAEAIAQMEVRADEPDAALCLDEQRIREYLKPLLPTRQDVDNWLDGKAFPFSKYDSTLGYLHIDRDFREGQDGAVCRYRYDELGARQMHSHAGQPCRINTYGDSFTSCEQVSDGETWQEVLAAHLGEPVRNYGIGGYSVYQAYLRMLREEQRAPAKYIIFNIFDDDHCRNLHSWQRFKFGVNNISINPTVPYVTVDLEKGEIDERPNPCPTAESISALCDLDSAYVLFKDDFVLENRVARAAKSAAGQSVPATDYDDERLMRFGIFATGKIVDRIEAFARTNGKRVLYVLSYGGYTIKQFIDTGFRFDQTLVNFLDERELAYVDLMRAHKEDAIRFKLPTDQYLARHFIGHYNPLGNFFCAFTIKDKFVRMLEPKPPAYSR